MSHPVIERTEPVSGPVAVLSEAEKSEFLNSRLSKVEVPPPATVPVLEAGTPDEMFEVAVAGSVAWVFKVEDMVAVELGTTLSVDVPVAVPLALEKLVVVSVPLLLGKIEREDVPLPVLLAGVLNEEVAVATTLSK